MDRSHQTLMTIYPVSSYTFGTKPPKFEKDTSVAQRMERLKDKYRREGIRRSVDAVLIVHEHNHPHILLVQVGTAFFKLPGGRLRPGEDEVQGLMRKLNNLLAPADPTFRPEWEVGQCLATYYRPNFENVVYPYCPPHVTRPKEIKRLWHVMLPERSLFSIPKNMRLVAVPLFEVYDNAQRYGPIISSIPQLLSRYHFILAGGPAGKANHASLNPQHTMPPQHAPQHQPSGQQQQQQVMQESQSFQQHTQQQAQHAQQQSRTGITVSFANQQQHGANGVNPSHQQPYQGGEADDSLFVDFDE